MRVTLTSHFPGKGGSNSLLAQVKEGLRERGAAVSVLVGDDCEDPVLRDYQVVTRRPRENWRSRIGRYASAIAETRPDVVYSLSGKEEMDVFRFIEFPRARQVSSLDNHEYTDMRHWFRQAGSCVDAVAANTPDVLEAVSSWQCGAYTELLVPYRIDSRFADAPHSADAGERAGAVEICYVGRLERFLKRAHWLPVIVRKCVDMGLDLRWHVYGSGESEQSILSELAARGVEDRVEMHGWVDPSDFPDRLSRHDLFFLCSRSEGLPIAMVEAMLCGLACVVPRIASGITYALSGGGGWLYDARRPADAVAALVEAVADRRELLKRRAAAQEFARQHFIGEGVERASDRFIEGLACLVWNGNVENLATAKRFRGVTPLVSLRRRALAPFKAWGGRSH
jgi:glycosyltransferase involved in cell wall biosynthesis